MQVASFLHEYVWSYLHPTPSKRPDAIKLGVLVENAELNPVTIIYPSKTHPGIILHALSLPISSLAPLGHFSKTPHQQHHKYSHHFAKTYTSHDALLQDQAITAVYICAPVSARYALAKKALTAGKHVLCESPVAGSSEGVKEVHGLAGEKGAVLLDGPDWQFHPATHAWRKIVDMREYGRLLRTEAVVTRTPGTPSTDPAWDFDCAGGSFITLAPALSATRFALHASTPSEILSSTPQLSPKDPRIDIALTAHLTFASPASNSNSVHSRIHTSLSSRPWILAGLLPRFWEAPSIEVETEFAIIYFYNFIQPHVYHYIGVTDKRSGEIRYKSVYKGGPLWGERVVSTGEKGGRGGWNSYRWRLEAFVDVVQGRTPVFWVSGQESVWMGECVDGVYRRAGLPKRESKEVNGGGDEIGNKDENGNGNADREGEGKNRL